jgi:hypothetical protein
MPTVLVDKSDSGVRVLKRIILSKVCVLAADKGLMNFGQETENG